MSLESSTKIGARASFSTAFSTFGHFSARTRPLRRSSLDTRAWEARKRCASSVSDISRENSATGTPGLHGRVLRDVRGGCALSHRGPRGEHDQVAGLETAGERVQVGESGRRARESDVGLGQLLELVDLIVQDRLERPHLRGAAVVADLEQHGLGALDQLPRLAVVGGHVVLDLAGGLEDAAKERMLLDDPRVVEHRTDCGDDRRERGQVALAARLFELARPPQLLGDRQHVHGLRRRLLLQADHRLEDRRVPRAVEVVGTQPHLEQHAVERLLREQDRPEDGGFSLLVVGRDAGRCLWRDGYGHAAGASRRSG